jgi:hypothetical protein
LRTIRDLEIGREKKYLSKERPSGLYIMRPTEAAENQFWQAQTLAIQVLNDSSAPEYARKMALAISGLAAGLTQMSIGLRATYMLIEQKGSGPDRNVVNSIR